MEVEEKSPEMPDFEKLAEEVPLLRQLIAQKEAARFGLHAAYADFFPQVYVNGNLGNSNTDAFPARNYWSAGLSMSLPIFDGGSRFAALSRAKAVLGQAIGDERSGRDEVILILADTWINLKNAAENVAVRRKFLEATEERAKIAKTEYAIGLMSFDNWIIIENDLVSAKKNYVSAEAGALIAEAAWIQARGGTLDYDKD